MTKDDDYEEWCKENPSKCHCEDDEYDRWADNRVDEYYDLMHERYILMEELVQLWEDKSTHTNNIEKRDYLEQKLVENLTGNSEHWLDINSIHGKWGSNQ